MISTVDMTVLVALFNARDPALTLFFENITFFGNALTIFVLAGILVITHCIRRRGPEMLAFLTTVLGSSFITVAIKYAVARPRPDQMYWAIREVGYSMPSAHAAMSLAFYGFCMWLIERSSLPRAMRITSVAVLGFLILMIGLSRLYLGVHYLSDVLVGYVVGGVVLYLAIQVAALSQKHLQKRHTH